jgi:hypothetical protein
MDTAKMPGLEISGILLINDHQEDPILPNFSQLLNQL